MYCQQDYNDSVLSLFQNTIQAFQRKFVHKVRYLELLTGCRGESLQDSIQKFWQCGKVNQEEHHVLKPRVVGFWGLKPRFQNSVLGLEIMLQKFIFRSWNPSLGSSVLEHENRAWKARFWASLTDFPKIGFTLNKTTFRKSFSFQRNRVYRSWLQRGITSVNFLSNESLRESFGKIIYFGQKLNFVICCNSNNDLI